MSKTQSQLEEQLRVKQERLAELESLEKEQTGLVRQKTRARIAQTNAAISELEEALEDAGNSTDEDEEEEDEE